MIKLNKNQANEIFDLLVIMDNVVKANSKIFSISIKEATSKAVRTMSHKITNEIRGRERKHIHSVGYPQNLKTKLKGVK